MDDKINFKEIQNFIKFVSKSGLDEVSIEVGEIKIKLKTRSDKKEFLPTVVSPVANIAGESNLNLLDVNTKKVENQAVDKSERDGKKHQGIKSPMVGTFYSKPAPDKPNFVKVGDTVKKGQVICIIEAMKMFNEIEAEQDCKIVEILIKDQTPVEFDEVLFHIEPI